jgi:3-hydroxyisobutyrate dehydrogenase-like beta-hydroxyacid dehydrogenase
MAETLGFIGLGQMGQAIAANLQASGFGLRIYNRTAEKARPFVDKGAAFATTSAGAAVAGGIVVSIVSNDAALEEIVTDEFLGALNPGGLHISMSTVSPATAQRLAERHRKSNSRYVGAPVFGRPEAAAARGLWICAGGRAEDKQRAKVVFDAVGKGVYDFGEDVGAGNVVKLAGNFLLTAAIEAMAEASALAEKNGIPRADLLNFFTATLFNCPVYNNYSKRLIAADFDKAGFNIPLILKDMTLVQQTARGSQTPMPTLNLLIDRYLTLMARGEGKLDASAIALGAARDAGLKW